MRQFGVCMKFKTLFNFMSDEKKRGHHFDLPLFFNISKQFLAPGGMSAECVKLVPCNPGPPGSFL